MASYTVAIKQATIGDVGIEMGDVKPPPIQKVQEKRSPNKYEEYLQPCLAEILGTMFYVCIGCMSVIENAPDAGWLRPALAHGIALAVMMSLMIKISGSHFNPCVTIAIYICQGMELRMVVPYLISQLIGGVLGAAMAKILTPADKYSSAAGAAYTVLRSEKQVMSAYFAETYMTCMTTMVVLLAMVNKKTKTPLAPLLVGCTVIISILAGSDVSGACMNPVRAFGPALLANHWRYHWVYWVGPMGGGQAASILLGLILGDHQSRALWK